MNTKQINIEKFKKYFNIQNIPEHIEYIFNTCDIKQRSPQWFNLRKITASKMGDLLMPQGYAKFILDQSNKQREGIFNQYIHAGKNLEYLSQQFYQKLFKAEVLEVSIVPSKKYNFIGASPDGLSLRDNNVKLLEIKNPTKREIKICSKNINDICPMSYYLQCICQMMCCEIEETDFWQTRIMVFNTKEEMEKNFSKDIVQITYNEYDPMKYTNIENVNYKGQFCGVVLKLYPKEYNKDHDIEYQTIYLYPDDIDMTYDQYEQWVENKKKEILQQNNTYFDESEEKEFYINEQNYKTYWRFEKGHLLQIKRDDYVIEKEMELINKAWEYIQYLKNNQELWKTINKNQKIYMELDPKKYYWVKIHQEKKKKFMDDMNFYIQNNVF